MTLRIVGGTVDDLRAKAKRYRSEDKVCPKCGERRDIKDYNVYGKGGNFSRIAKTCIHCRRPWYPRVVIYGTSDAIKSFDDFTEYLSSEHWKSVKERYSKSKRPKQCYICSKTYEMLVHRSYEHIGNEYLTEVVAVCRSCNQEIHALHSHKPALSLWRATRDVRSNHRKRSARQKDTKGQLA